MYKIGHSKQFKKDLRKLEKSGRFKANRFNFVIDLLATGKTLPANYHDHFLQGKLDGLRECHIGPDLLLVYGKNR